MEGPQEGYKLVAGRKGNKKFSDETEAETIMRAARIKIDDMFNRKLKSPTQLEKQLKGDKPKVWTKLEALVSQADGKPVVAPDSDRRPALPATASQFDDLEDLVARRRHRLHAPHRQAPRHGVHHRT